MVVPEVAPLMCVSPVETHGRLPNAARHATLRRRHALRPLTSPRLWPPAAPVSPTETLSMPAPNSPQPMCVSPVETHSDLPKAVQSATGFPHEATSFPSTDLRDFDRRQNQCPQWGHWTLSWTNSLEPFDKHLPLTDLRKRTTQKKARHVSGFGEREGVAQVAAEKSCAIRSRTCFSFSSVSIPALIFTVRPTESRVIEPA